jgi:hypothetical protein
MNNIEVYIKNQEGDYLPIDIFDNERIQIEDSIQNVRDISKIFNTFTRDFKVPASYENNKLFKHYYNLNIQNGFDGRVKTKALIKVGGVDYREGYIRMLSVGLKNNKPSHYKITFQGLATSLKDVLQDDELKDLEYTGLQFENTVFNKWVGVRYGLNLNNGSVPANDDDGFPLYPDVIYAPIFSHGKVVPVPYQPSINTTDDSSYTPSKRDFTLTRFTGIGPMGTLVSNEPNANGEYFHDPVSIDDYKPSIKVGRIIKMINDKYDLKFSKQFYQLEEVDQMYIHYNGKRDKPEIDNSNKAFNQNTGNNTSAYTDSIRSVEYTTEANPPTGVFQFPVPGGYTDWNRTYTEDGQSGISSYSWDDVQKTKADFKAEWTDSSVYPPNVKFILSKFYRDDDGEKVVVHSREYYSQGRPFNATQPLVLQIDAGMIGFYPDRVTYNATVPDNKAIEFSMILESTTDAADLEKIKVGTQYVKVDVSNTGFQYTYTPATAAEMITTPVTTSAYISFVEKAPKLKLIDLLLGVFKMLNLTSYVDPDGSVRVLPLRDYYAAGNTHDITQYVEESSHTVENGFIYRNVNMKHEEPSDILTKNFITGVDGVKYGDIRVNKENILGDVGTSEIADGRDYNIESPFARMMFEKVAQCVDINGNIVSDASYSASSGGNLTDCVIGNLIDDKLEEVETKPIIFFGKRVDQISSYTPSSSIPVTINDIGGRVTVDGVNTTIERGNTAGSIGKDLYSIVGGLILTQPGGVSTNINKLVTDDILEDPLNINPTLGTPDKIGATLQRLWWNPSGIMASRYRRDGVTLMNPYGKFVSLSFDGSQAYDEAEYTNQFPSSEWIVGLYQNNYEDYLKNLYEKTSRISKFNVNFPASLIQAYSLNDTMIVGTNEYNINKIKIDLLTGKGDVELINKIEIPVVEIEENLGEIVKSQITGVNLLPAAGNYIYDISVVTKTFTNPDPTIPDVVSYVNTYNGDNTISDAEISIDRMLNDFENLESISVITTWYGDTDNPDMVIKPRLDLDEGSPTYSTTWQVGSYNRTNTPEVIINSEGKPNQGGTPGDIGLVEFVQECNTRGIKVMLYPFLQMDTVDKGWRGMIPFTSKADIDTWWTQYEPFIRHYSQLFANNGVQLDKFMIGTELVTLTRYHENGRYFGVEYLTQLAEDVRTDFGASNTVQVSYGANWDEYHSHDGKYSMDELWTSPYIDAVGIDNYFPATDFQDPQTVTYDDIYNGYESGEGWDHYYSVYNDPSSKVNYATPGDEFAWKNVFGWWDRNHTAHSYTTAGTVTLGAELLTSADFSSIAWPWNYGTWSYIPTPTVSGGIATLPISGGDFPTVNPRIEQEIVTISGETYTVEVDVNNAGGIAIQALTVDPNNSFAYLNGDTQTFATNGILTFDFTATSVATTLQILVQGVDGDSVELNSASIKQQTSSTGSTVTKTPWTARMKPLFFAEYGFASVDGTTNQPNVFAPGLPRLSNGITDFNAMRIGLNAFNDYWDDKTVGITGFAEDRFAWAYDLRPFPQFPNGGIWDDSSAWEKGHWMNGKL